MTGLLVRTALVMAKEEIVHVHRKSPPPTLAITYTQSRSWTLEKQKRTLNFLGLEILWTANF